jgi:hypothetical protein
MRTAARGGLLVNLVALFVVLVHNNTTGIEKVQFYTNPYAPGFVAHVGMNIKQLPQARSFLTQLDVPLKPESLLLEKGSRPHMSVLVSAKSNLLIMSYG